MFKRSLFNITVDILENNDILVFNTMSTAFAKMDQVTQKLYNSYNNNICFGWKICNESKLDSRQFNDYLELL